MRCRLIIEIDHPSPRVLRENRWKIGVSRRTRQFRGPPMPISNRPTTVPATNVFPPRW